MAAGLKAIQTAIYLLLLACTAAILGIYSYFVGRLVSADLYVSPWKRAVQGLSAAAILYLLFAVLLTCFLAHRRLFSILGLLLDLLFVGALIAIAVFARDGVDNCDRGYVETPLGHGDARGRTLVDGSIRGARNFTWKSPRLRTACRLNKAAFILAVIGAFLFLVAALIHVLLARQRSREKRYATTTTTSTYNTAGKRKFWQPRREPVMATRDAEYGSAVNGTTTTTATAPLVATNGYSHHQHTTGVTGDTTGYTGTTVAPAGVPYHKYDGPANSGNYYTGPTGSAVVDNRTTAHNY